jgi:hypothetical protein
MTDAHGIYIPRDLIMEGFDDDCTPEYRDIDAPTGACAGFLVMILMGVVFGLGAGWLIWHR